LPFPCLDLSSERREENVENTLGRNLRDDCAVLRVDYLDPVGRRARQSEPFLGNSAAVHPRKETYVELETEANNRPSSEYRYVLTPGLRTGRGKVKQREVSEVGASLKALYPMCKPRVPTARAGHAFLVSKSGRPTSASRARWSRAVDSRRATTHVWNVARGFQWGGPDTIPSCFCERTAVQSRVETRAISDARREARTSA
jgi:hypothetical protein